jgi:predicted ATP-dependent endonuclease of OLD family
MKLKKFWIKNFRSIKDSGEVFVDDVTCLVGKNESGKTSILEALHRLNPLDQSHMQHFDPTDDYPRSEVSDYQQAVGKGTEEPCTVISATFNLEDHEVSIISTELGPCLLKPEIILEKGYYDDIRYGIEIDEKIILKHILKSFTLKEGYSAINSCLTIKEAYEIVKADPTNSTLNELLKKLLDPLAYIYKNYITKFFPQFIYFDEYSQMEGLVNLPKLKSRIEGKKLLDSDFPLLGLLYLANINIDEIEAIDRTQAIRNILEGASNRLSRDITKYWSQNKNLKMTFELLPGRQQDPEGATSGQNLWSSVYDNKRSVSTNVSTRSKGFVWFFSFMAWFAYAESWDKSIIMLLDEPGLSLHGKAQQDLLKFFDAKIRGKYQLLYTTHSPFMVDVNRSSEIRIVEDRSLELDDLEPEEEGTKVVTDVLSVNSDSLFPLQSALGYDVCQSLFIGPNSLIVEGPSDLLYLEIISSMLARRGRTCLDKRWVITPVGGSSNIPSFLALMGAKPGLNLAVLIDYQTADSQKIEGLYKSKLIEKSRIITFSQFTNKKESDIEDMFELGFYLQLLNMEYKDELATPITEELLNKKIPRILMQIEKYLGKDDCKITRYNHYRCARYFSEHIKELEASISEETFNRFESCFSQINAFLRL